ncbi:hypothetical protein U9M48_041051 [Paspalum notatum var. saurae]|uniref:Uncharacterized protein n=1 Tax=Paspalum notatum var. saurae TaxID=547442 RepID=A0AAQ3XEE5_PASNO
MAAAGGINLLHRRLVGLLPEIESPTSRGAIPLRHKAAYTAASLAVFLVGSNLLPYWTGVRRYAPASVVVSPLYWNNSLHNANGDTVMALGVTPLAVSGFVLHAFIFLRQEIAGNGAPDYQDHPTLLLTRNNGSRKLLAILIAFGMSVRETLVACSACSSMDTALIVLQLFLGAVIIIYIDEVLRKGYGLLPSGISLFTVANISVYIDADASYTGLEASTPFITFIAGHRAGASCGAGISPLKEQCLISPWAYANIFWKAFSPYYSALRGDMHRAVAVSSLLHRLISSGDDELSAMPKAWQHRELPDMAGTVATCVFFHIVLSLQGLCIVVPRRQHQVPFQMNYTIRPAYVAFAPLVFQVPSYLYLIPQAVPDFQSVGLPTMPLTHQRGPASSAFPFLRLNPTEPVRCASSHNRAAPDCPPLALHAKKKTPLTACGKADPRSRTVRDFVAHVRESERDESERDGAGRFPPPSSRLQPHQTRHPSIRPSHRDPLTLAAREKIGERETRRRRSAGAERENRSATAKHLVPRSEGRKPKEGCSPSAPEHRPRSEARAARGRAVPGGRCSNFAAVKPRHLCILCPETCSTPQRQAKHGPEKLSEDTDEYDYFNYTEDLEQAALPRTIAMNKGLDFGIAESGSFQVLCAAVTIWFWMQERRIVVTVAQPNSAPYDHEWRFYVAAVAFLVGLCIGALQLLAGLAGVVGSGTGIMLAVTIIYSSLEGRGRTGAFGL